MAKKDEFTRQVLVNGIQSKNYKFTYTEKDLSEEEIIDLIEKKTVKITAKCFARVEAITFSKIRTGLIEEKTHHQRRNREQEKTLPKREGKESTP